MKRARLKKKKKNKSFKIVFLVIILFLSIAFTIKHLSIKDINLNDKEYVSYLVNTSYKNNNSYSFIVNKILKLFSLDVSKPETFLTFNKTKTSSSKKYTKVKEEDPKEDNYDPNDYDKVTSYIQVNNEITDPIIYIYNTHQLETYEPNNQNMVPNVMMAGSLLSEKLNKNGVKSVFEDTNLYDFITKMGLPKDELYGGSRVFINNAKEKYSTLKYFIDLHRDSVDKDISTISIDGKDYARVLFVLGTTNSNYEENRVIMEGLNNIINEKYPKLSRGIYEVDIPDWPEIYNQDLDKNAILIELGAKYNNMNEVLNTIDVLADALTKYIKEDK